MLRVLVFLGHDFGDYYLMKDFIDAVGLNDVSFISSTPEEVFPFRLCSCILEYKLIPHVVVQTLESHIIVFRAEKARKENMVSSISW